MTDDEAPILWAELVGTCYTTTSLARTHGVALYPAFQLHEGRVADGLSDVLAVLQTGTAAHWTWAQRLNTALPDEDVPRAIDALRAGRLVEVLRDAEHDAWAWRS